MSMTPQEIEKLIQGLRKDVQGIKKDSEREEALIRLQDIAKTYEGEDRVISSLEIAQTLSERPPEYLMESGIGGLDQILGGFRLKQLIVLSGVTKHGKTSFAIDLTSRLKDQHPMWLPFEEPAEEIIQKFMDRGEEPPLFYSPTFMPNNTMQWIEQKIIESKAKFGSKIVFIDHLGFILPRKDQLAQEIGFVMRDLKGLAKKWDVAIVLLSHLKKVEINKNPNLEDIRDSSSVAQEADTVIFIWRNTTKHPKTGEIEISNEVNVSVQANRRTGKTGNVKMVYANGKFFEEEWVQVPAGYTRTSKQDVDEEWYAE